MSFQREKRLLLGWLALGAPLPLPFNQVLEWPALFLFLAALIFFLRRAEDPAFNPLTNRQLNVLGLIYLPFLGFDLWLGASRGQMVPALLHMLLFVLVVKLFAIRQEKDKWQVLLAIFFVFVASMATSSHVSVALYLLAATAAAVVALGRLAYWHTLTALGRERRAVALPAKPMRRTAVAGLLAAILLAVPIFAIMPRFTEPFLVRRGSDGFALGRVSGFTDDVGLDGSGSIRSSREIAMRIEFAGAVPNPEGMRFKGSALDYYRDRRWKRDNAGFTELPPPDEDNRYVLRAARAGAPSNSAAPPPNPAVGSAVIYLAPLQSAAVIVPTETVAVRFRSRQSIFFRDGGGGLALPNGQRRDDLVYEVELGARSEIWPELTTDLQGDVLALDQGGVSGRIADLAREVAGEGTDAEKLQRIESYLLTNYGYTLDQVSPDDVDPIEYFLFEGRAGNCELFASAMVLMARAQGIPARFATGFLGAEPNPIENFHIVRQSNAHAWVEGMSAEGWRIYDPTPPIGRPSISPQSLRLLVQQLYDFVLFRWDRYVLTYGAEDQLSMRERLNAWLLKIKEWWGSEEAPPTPADLPSQLAAKYAAESAEAVARRDWRWPIAGGIAFLLVTALLAWRAWRKKQATASSIFAHLRQDLERNDLGIQPATPPLAVLAQLSELLPAQAPAVAELRRRYLHESFAGEKEATPVAEIRALPGLLRQALAVRRRERHRRKG